MKTSIIFGAEGFFLVVASRVRRKVVHINPVYSCYLELTYKIKAIKWKTETFESLMYPHLSSVFFLSIIKTRDVLRLAS